MTTCPTCSEEFSALGRHWRWSEECVVKIPPYKMEILRGVLMGDGWVGSSGRVIQAEWACKEYAQYISEELEWVCGGVKERKDRNGIYQVSTISHDMIENDFSSWYSDGEKVWDTSTPLTQTAMRHLYACDGHLSQRDGRTSAAVIACTNEAERINEIVEWIDNSGFPRPTIHTPQGDVCLYFSTKNTPKLLNMIEPVDGYEYKWNYE